MHKKLSMRMRAKICLESAILANIDVLQIKTYVRIARTRFTIEEIPVCMQKHNAAREPVQKEVQTRARPACLRDQGIALLLVWIAVSWTRRKHALTLLRSSQLRQHSSPGASVLSQRLGQAPRQRRARGEVHKNEASAAAAGRDRSGLEI